MDGSGPEERTHQPEENIRQLLFLARGTVSEAIKHPCNFNTGSR